ncbi:MAG: hypothetical protein PUP92_28265 [Rhizonema sp. PD38]|nr:hypothetical protein [Rhizonema sp. PD38]
MQLKIWLTRLQHSRKEATKSNNNVIVEQSSATESTTKDIPVLDESEKLDDDNNVIVNQEFENQDVSDNVIGKDANDEIEALKPVNPDLKIVEEVFEGLVSLSEISLW